MKGICRLANRKNDIICCDDIPADRGRWLVIFRYVGHTAAIASITLSVKYNKLGRINQPLSCQKDHNNNLRRTKQLKEQPLREPQSSQSNTQSWIEWQ